MSRFSGQPTALPAVNLFTNDPFVPLEQGGIGQVLQAKHALKLGDLVYLGHDGKATKSLGSSFYQRSPLGIVIGGENFDDDYVLDSTMVGATAADADERVLVLRHGICYAVADATGIYKGNPISAGRSTAGRVRGDMLTSFARSSAGLAIKAGSSAVVKAVNITQTQVAGVQGTATAANLDMAALSGTVTNAAYNVFEFRVAANGTTVTSAMGTEASTRDGIVFPTGSASLAVLGWVFIHPTGTGNFVGGTTALDSGTVVPNAIYVDAVGLNRPLGYALEDGGAAASAVLVQVSCIVI